MDTAILPWHLTVDFYHDKDVIFSSTEESQTFPSSPNNKVRFRVPKTIVPIVDEIPRSFVLACLL